MVRSCLRHRQKTSEPLLFRTVLKIYNKKKQISYKNVLFQHDVETACCDNQRWEKLSVIT